MAKQHDKLPQAREIKQAGLFIQAICAVGLIAIILFSIFKEAPVSPLVFAIFGGGLLGTDNILKLLKAVFRIGNGND